MIIAAQSTSNSNYSFLIFMVVIFGAMYLLMIRPQQKKRQQYLELVRSVEVGDEVETVAGIFGTIKRMDDETMWIEVAPGTTLKMSRGAIRRKVTSESSDDRT